MYNGGNRLNAMLLKKKHGNRIIFKCRLKVTSIFVYIYDSP